MFVVFNKDKIISYFISFSTVVILLGMAFFIKSQSGLLEVANTEKKLPIYSVKITR